jgi:hypothetical protein
MVLSRYDLLQRAVRRLGLDNKYPGLDLASKSRIEEVMRNEGYDVELEIDRQRSLEEDVVFPEIGIGAEEEVIVTEVETEEEKGNRVFLLGSTLLFALGIGCLIIGGPLIVITILAALRGPIDVNYAFLIWIGLGVLLMVPFIYLRRKGIGNRVVWFRERLRRRP